MNSTKSRARSITTLTGSLLSLGHEATRKLLALVRETPALRRRRLVQLCLMLCIPLVVLFLQVFYYHNYGLTRTSYHSFLALTRYITVWDNNEIGFTCKAKRWNNRHIRYRWRSSQWSCDEAAEGARHDEVTLPDWLTRLKLFSASFHVRRINFFERCFLQHFSEFKQVRSRQLYSKLVTLLILPIYIIPRAILE